MAVLQSIQSGNFLDASTWGLVDSTSYLDARTTENAVTTVQTNSTTTFTPGAITVAGVALQLGSRIAIPSGTMTVRLFNNTTSAVVKDVVINIADLPSTNGVLTGGLIGWTYFKFDSNVTLIAGNIYSVRVFSSVNSTVTVYRNATTNNWSRALVTATTQAPVATDTVITSGAYTAAGINTSVTVTMNSISTATQYGNCYVGSNGTFNYGIAPSTNYGLRLNGDLLIGRGATFTIGTVDNPMPSTSTAILEITCASALQFGVLNYGTLETKYETTVLHRALLNADIAAGATSMTTDVSTGWKQNDVIVIPSTTRTTSQHERRVLSANASGTTLTIPAISFAHDGNAAIYMQADLANLTRNIKIRSTNTTFKTRFRQGRFGITTFFDVEFFELGSNSHISGSNVTDGTFNLQQCSFWQIASPGSSTLFSGINTTSNTISNNVFYSYTDMSQTIKDNNLIIGFTGFSAITTGGFGSNNVIASCNQSGLGGVTLTNGSSGNRFYSTGGNGAIYSSTNVVGFSVSDYVFFNNAIAIRYVTGSSTLSSDRSSFEIFENCYFYGNVENISVISSATGYTNRKFWFNNCFFWAGKTGLLTAIGYSAINTDYMHFSNCTFGRRPNGGDSNFSTSCLRGGQAGTTFTNCLYFGPQVVTFVSTNIFTSVHGFNGITSLKHNGVTNDYRQFQSNGSLQNDNSITYNGLPTIRIKPEVATNKTFSNPFRIAVSSGQTCNISVNIRKSGGLDTLYTGNQPRLMYAFNPLAGNLSETVAATPSITNNLILGTAPENLSTVPWTGFGTSVTQNSTAAPNGIVNADTVTATNVFAYRSYPVVKAALAITYTASMYAKKGINDWIRFGINDENQGAYVWFNLNTGVVGTAQGLPPFILNSYSIESVGDGWYLLTVNATSSTLTTIVLIFNFVDGNGTFNTIIGSTYFLWGAQLVVGGAQNYIPEGSWQTLSYTTPVVDHDSVLEFYVDCDGTTGWININDFKTTTSNDTKSMNYWSTVGVYAEPDWRRPGGTVTFVT